MEPGGYQVCVCVCVCVRAHVTADFRGQFCVLTHQQGTSEKWGRPRS